ncbi:MAG: hypothetical protein J6T70_12420 [Bacteroidales bacterium]|nr:hypothetical protein [Bacteroidales bacterium]
MENLKHFSPPFIHLAQTTAKKPYAKPDFQVIPLVNETPLLAGSGTPSPKINPIKPSSSEW